MYRDALDRIVSAFSLLVIKIFSKPAGRRLNDAILRLVLRGRGYNNYRNLSESGELSFVRALGSTEAALCIDVGANKGEYTKCLLENTRSVVFAFEPLPAAYACLVEIAAEHPDRLFPMNFGVGAEDGDFDLYYGSEDSPLATLSPEVNAIKYVGAENVNRMRVPVHRLDGLIDEMRSHASQVDLLKIDTEGFEAEVLRGAQAFIREMRPRFIQVEFNWHHLFRSCTLNDLAALLPGYSAFQMLPYGGGLVARDPSMPESNIFHFSTFVFVRSDAVLPDY
jgi:FkbM family methyltransferase